MNNQQVLECIVNELTILATAFGEALTAERMKLYVQDLADIPIDRLVLASTRARRELKFFPKISEIRELVVASRKQQDTLGAEAAWDRTQDYLRVWGLEPRVRWGSAGREIRPPKMSRRTEYAVRAVGGLARINAATDYDFAFIRRDFIDAWIRYEDMEQVRADRALEAASARALPGQPRQSEPEAGRQALAGVEGALTKLATDPADPAEMEPITDELNRKIRSLTAQREARGVTAATRRPVIPTLDRREEQSLIAEHVARHRENCRDVKCSCRQSA